MCLKREHKSIKRNVTHFRHSFDICHFSSCGSVLRVGCSSNSYKRYVRYRNEIPNLLRVGVRVADAIRLNVLDYLLGTAVVDRQKHYYYVVHSFMCFAFGLEMAHEMAWC